MSSRGRAWVDEEVRLTRLEDQLKRQGITVPARGPRPILTFAEWMQDEQPATLLVLQLRRDLRHRERPNRRDLRRALPSPDPCR